MPDRQRFVTLWKRMVGGDPGLVWSALDEGYADPARAYHNWNHIQAMVTGLDAVRDEAEFLGMHPDEVEMAIWFHDAIYEPRAKDNEERSAELFQRSAGNEPIMGEAGVKRVISMILATRTHQPSDDASTRLLLDLDLAVLGGSPEHYTRYAASVRQEYAFVDEQAWRQGRSAVLKHFLECAKIFQSRAFAHLEAPARANITGEISELSA